MAWRKTKYRDVPLPSGEVSGISPQAYTRLTLGLAIPSTGRADSSAMSRASVSPQGPRPARATSARPAVRAREAGLELIRRVNRWLVAGAIAAAGILSLLAAHAFHGRTLTAGGAGRRLGRERSAGCGVVGHPGAECVQRSTIRRADPVTGVRRPGACGAQADRRGPVAHRARYPNRRPAAQQRRGGDDLEQRHARHRFNPRRIPGPGHRPGRTQRRGAGEEPTRVARDTTADRSALGRRERRGERPPG